MLVDNKKKKEIRKISFKKREKRIHALIRSAGGKQINGETLNLLPKNVRTT